MATEFDLQEYERSALYDPASSWVQEEISDQVFNLYHTIDRTLFQILIGKLGRNVDESMHMVAFLIWLERINYSRNAVYKVISWPLQLVHQLSVEVAAILMCLISPHSGAEHINLYFLRILCSRYINLPDFHKNRIKILENVKKVVNEVCMRAFQDLVNGGREVPRMEGDPMRHVSNNNPVFVPSPIYPHFVPAVFPQLGFVENRGPGNYPPSSPQLANVLEDPNADLGEMFGGLQLMDDYEDEPDVPIDDRTIFLTFSKGYYIPEVEIRLFFTSIFGEFIEEIHMQEVSSDEQPLYARMVCRSSAIIPKIAPPGNKAMYSINGKHIYAKKYVRQDKKRAKKLKGSTSQSAAN